MTANEPTARKGHETGESFNEPPKHRCDRCGHNWTYTGNAERPTCPSCLRKVDPDERQLDEEPREFVLVALEGGGDIPRFDTDVTIDVANQTGRAMVVIDLSKEECEAIYDHLRESDHDYPEDARARALDALGLTESGVTDVAHEIHGD